jgi:hypothetical protein
MFKSLLTILTLLFIIDVRAQSNLPKTGRYQILDQNPATNLHLNQDSTFQIVTLDGKYRIEGNGIKFTSNSSVSSSDFLMKIEEGQSKDSIDLVLDKMFTYGYDHNYIALQSSTDGTIKFENIINLIKKEFGEEYYFLDQDYVVRIPKTANIYVVKHPDDESTRATKFTIPEKASKVYLSISTIDTSSMNLVGKINSEGNLTLFTEEEQEIISFVHESNLGQELAKYLSPITMEADSLGFDIDEIDEIESEENEDYYEEYAAETAGYEEQAFTVSRYTSHAEAMEALKSDPKKMLVIFYDPKNKEERFNKFLSQYENSMNSNMYGEYNSEYDKCIFLYTTKPIPGVVEKSNKSRFLMQNNLGAIFYNSVGGIKDHENIFYSFDYYDSEFERASINAKANLLAKQKFDPIVILDLFTELHTISTAYNLEPVIAYSEEVSSDDAAQAVVEMIQNENQFLSTHTYLFDTQIINHESLTQIEIPYATLTEIYAQLIAYHRTNKIASFQLSTIIAEELKNEGYSSKIIPSFQKVFTETDYAGIEYLLENELALSDLCAKDQQEREQSEEYSYNFMSDYNCNFSNFLSYLISYQYNYTDSNSVRANLEILKRMAAKANKYSNMSHYFNIGSQNSEIAPLQPSFYEEYDLFITEILNKNPSIIETLDEILDELHAGQSNHQYSQWDDFKYEFATLANNIAWNTVITLSTNLELNQKALNWSIVSNKVAKNNYYFLDTLAQLYYKNGQKELAIAKETEAIELARKNEDEEYALMFEEVLQKMKNGSYGMTL